MIIAAALQYTNNMFDAQPIIFSMPAPARHPDILVALWHLNRGAHTDCEQGFLTDRGEFLDRENAWLHVLIHAQPLIDQDRRWSEGKELFSEDLW